MINLTVQEFFLFETNLKTKCDNNNSPWSLFLYAHNIHFIYTYIMLFSEYSTNLQYHKLRLTRVSIVLNIYIRMIENWTTKLIHYNGIYGNAK